MQVQMTHLTCLNPPPPSFPSPHLSSSLHSIHPPNPITTHNHTIIYDRAGYYCLLYIQTTMQHTYPGFQNMALIDQPIQAQINNNSVVAFSSNQPQTKFRALPYGLEKLNKYTKYLYLTKLVPQHYVFPHSTAYQIN